MMMGVGGGGGGRKKKKKKKKKTYLKQEWLVAFWNTIQTYKRFKRTLIYYDTDTQSADFSGVIPFVKLQNDT